MAKRRKKAQAEVKPAVTRKEYLRRHKDDRQRRALLSVLGVVLSALIVFLGFGFYREYQQQRTPVATVNGETITGTQFSERLGYDRWQMLRNMASLSQLAQTSDPSFLQQLFGQQRSNLPQTTVDTLIDEMLVRQEADSRGIEATDDDVDERLDREFAPLYATGEGDEAADSESDGSQAEGDGAEDADSGTDSITETLLAEAEGGTGSITETVGAGDAVTDTEEMGDTLREEAADAIEATEAITDPVSATETAVAELPTLEPSVFEQAVTEYINPILAQTGIGRKAYWNIVRQQIIRERLNEELGAEMPITDKQVELDYMIFADEETASQASEALNSGGEWSDVAKLFERPPATPTPSTDEATDEATDVLTDTVGAELMERLGSESAITTTEGITVTDEADEEDGSDDGVRLTERITATDGLTATDGVTATDGITATGSITPTIAPTMTPAPTATPDPYATEVGERRWFTRDSIKERLGFGDEDTNTILGLEVGSASEPLFGSSGHYVIVVVNVDDSRELDETELEQRRETAVDDWLNERRTTAAIDRFDFNPFVTPEPAWFVEQYNRYAGPGVVQPTIDLNVLSQPTEVSVPQEPAGDEGGE